MDNKQPTGDWSNLLPTNRGRRGRLLVLGAELFAGNCAGVTGRSATTGSPHHLAELFKRYRAVRTTMDH